MNFKKSQSGRSMVEMLGVLAIIGVLSVGGISGYTISMRKHRANGVIDTVSKYGLVAYAECQRKLLSGEIHISGAVCGVDRVMSFADAGVGSLPSGVTKIEVDYVYLDSQVGYDHADIKTTFSDSKLCQATASTIGSTCVNNMVMVNLKYY